MDHALLADGRFGLAGVARVRARRAAGVADLLCATGAEYRLVGNFLWLADARCGLRGDCHPLAGNPVYNLCLLLPCAAGCSAARPLCALGDLRLVSELGNLAPEPFLSISARSAARRSRRSSRNQRR